MGAAMNQMASEIAVPAARIIRTERILPPIIEQVLRRLTVDKFTGNVQLNLKDGKILGWHEHKIGSVPSHEIT